MIRYFRADDHMKPAPATTSDQLAQAVTAPSADTTVSADPVVNSRPPSPRGHAFPMSPRGGQRDATFAPVLDELLVCSDNMAARSVTVAAAAGTNIVDDAVAGLVKEVTRRGLCLFAARLDQVRNKVVVKVLLDSLLHDAQSQGSPSASLAESLTIGRGSRSMPSELKAWVDRACEAYDLVVLVGPDLQSTMDSAILSLGCDGLLLLAEAEATLKKELRVAVQRARSVGSHIFGVSMVEKPDPILARLRRS